MPPESQAPVSWAPSPIKAVLRDNSPLSSVSADDFSTKNLLQQISDKDSELRRLQAENKKLREANDTNSRHEAHQEELSLARKQIEQLEIELASCKLQQNEVNRTNRILLKNNARMEELMQRSESRMVEELEDKLRISVERQAELMKHNQDLTVRLKIAEKSVNKGGAVDLGLSLEQLRHRHIRAVGAEKAELEEVLRTRAEMLKRYGGGLASSLDDEEPCDSSDDEEVCQRPPAKGHSNSFDHRKRTDASAEDGGGGERRSHKSGQGDSGSRGSDRPNHVAVPSFNANADDSEEDDASEQPAHMWSVPVAVSHGSNMTNRRAATAWWRSMFECVTVQFRPIPAYASGGSDLFGES